ncbi:MAG: chemotaxis protein CheA, partial [Longimicrobiales bacterium]
RMVPLRPLFQRLHRLVRDLARQSGKQVELVTEGEDTEIDRTMVDVLTDPLVHMIRNALDHGLEPPAERVASGKPAVGALRLTASHVGGAVVVELQDDGRGMDRERVLRKAVERGIVASGQELSDAEIDALIFAPGLSTAGRVTELSGRGVGMDVVQRNIEALRGRIEIASARGAGTTFTLRLPLTLAVTDGLLVGVGGERYVVPTFCVVTSFRPDPAALVREASGGELVMLHGRPVPVLRLHHVFGIEDTVTDPTAALLVVIAEGKEHFALLVDQLLGYQQFVAKPLAEGLGTVAGVAGSAVLGDGRVGLIIDAAGLLARARGMPPWERGSAFDGPAR